MALTALTERFRPFNRDSVMVIAIDGEDLLLVREYAVGTEQYELGFVKVEWIQEKRPNKVQIVNCRKKLLLAQKNGRFSHHEDQSTNHGS